MSGASRQNVEVRPLHLLRPTGKTDCVGVLGGTSFSAVVSAAAGDPILQVVGGLSNWGLQ